MNDTQDAAMQLASGIAAFEAKHFSQAMKLHRREEEKGNEEEEKREEKM